MQPHFEESEIWVGKGAGVGAHLRVPSVRGDKVLWMCGGHQENRQKLGIDSAGMQPKQRGDIEPCNPTIKASPGIQRFTHVKELLKTIDGLVEKLSSKVKRLRNVKHRSDAMVRSRCGRATATRHARLFVIGP